MSVFELTRLVSVAPAAVVEPGAFTPVDGGVAAVGWLMVDQGNTKEGLPLLQKAAGLAPQLLDIRYHYAAALNKSGDKAGARKELTDLLAQNKPFGQIDEARALLKTL